MAIPDLTLNLKTKDGQTPKNPTATAEYKARLAEFGAAHAGKTFVSPADMATCRRIGEAVAALPAAAEVLNAPADREACVLWQDPATGLWCKALVDHLAADVVADLKTTDDASPAAFARSVAQHSWHVQAAFYLWGLSVVGRPRQRFLHVAVETAEPHGVAVYELDDESLDQGIREARVYLDRWAECVAAGRWPCYPDVVQPLNVPRWALNTVGV